MVLVVKKALTPQEGLPTHTMSNGEHCVQCQQMYGSDADGINPFNPLLCSSNVVIFV
jgi:hypothetical protein